MRNIESAMKELIEDFIMNEKPFVMYGGLDIGPHDIIMSIMVIFKINFIKIEHTLRGGGDKYHILVIYILIFCFDLNFPYVPFLLLMQSHFVCRNFQCLLLWFYSLIVPMENTFYFLFRINIPWLLYKYIILI